MLDKLRANTRATARLLAGAAFVPVFILLAGAHAVIGPLTEKNHKKIYNFIPNLLYKSIRPLLGLKVEFNAASAPQVKDKPTWFVSNHISIADFVVHGSTLNGTFAGKGDLLKVPGIAQLLKTVKYIGLRRSKQYNPQSIAKIMKNFNAGFNTIMFPEATTTDGKQVAKFHAGLLTMLFGEKGVDKEGKEIKLDKEVVVQPVAMRVKSVDGKDATGNDELREKYAQYYEDNTIKRIWKRLQVKKIVVEVKYFDPLRPADFTDAKELANKACEQIASFASPGQTTFEFAKIPGQPQKEHKKTEEAATAATEQAVQATAPAEVKKPAAPTPMA
jgi:lyso-ornithine lipid O-acyltransferase